MIDFFMDAKRRTTIFRQLILNVMLPPILALLIRAVHISAPGCVYLLNISRVGGKDCDR